MVAIWRNLSPSSRRRWRWIMLGVSALLFRIPFGLWPEVTESVYSRGVFQGIRYVLDYTLGLLPFPVVYLLLAGLVGWGIWVWVKNRRSAAKPDLKTRILRFCHGLMAFVSGMIFFFMVLWGYNYQRVPVETTLQIDPAPLDSAALHQTAIRLRLEMIAARTAVTADTSSLADTYLPSDLRSEMRGHLSAFLRSQGYPTPGRVRTSGLWPPGALMRFGVAGIYIPYTGEGYLPTDMPRFDQPFTVAHEMSHAMGFGNEGTCNFLAYMACEQSQQPVLQYCGRLNYWGYVMRELYRVSPDLVKELNESLPAGIQADRRVLRNYSRSYRSFLTTLGYSVNNAYLKTQGISAGILSYNRMVVLVEGYRVK